jgi:AcrR family transcriptional regulator
MFSLAGIVCRTHPRELHLNKVGQPLDGAFLRCNVLNMCSKRVIDAPESVTRDSIAKAAARQFAKRGIDETTMRDIVQDAGISLGTINYHFGSKLGLAYEVFERVAWAACEERNAAYDALEAAAGGRPLGVDAIFRALFRPYLEGEENRRLLLIYILQQRHLNRLDLAHEIGQKFFDQIALRTIAMLRKACPHLSAREVSWRYNLSLAAVLWVVSDCGPDNRLKMLSAGAADASDRQQLVQQIIEYVVGAFERGAGGQTSAQEEGT